MNESIISVRYTKALFLIAEEKGLLDNIKKDMEMIFSIMSENNELLYIFQNPVIKPSKKQEVVRNVFTSFHDLTISFINLLIKNRRENHLLDISRNFLSKYRQNKGIESAVFTTAVEMESGMIEKVKNLIKAALKTEIELSGKTDKNIVGGFIIRIGDKQIDSSVKTNLNKIRKKLLDTTVDVN
jgi:F-type H+-transporting ATPase subunit delta